MKKFATIIGLLSILIATSPPAFAESEYRKLNTKIQELTPLDHVIHLALGMGVAWGIDYYLVPDDMSPWLEGLSLTAATGAIGGIKELTDKEPSGLDVASWAGAGLAYFIIKKVGFNQKEINFMGTPMTLNFLEITLREPLPGELFDQQKTCAEYRATFTINF
jgi:hypothetical protein